MTIRSQSLPLLLLVTILSLLTSACYEPAGLIPEPRLTAATPEWTNEDVDAVVSMTFHQIPSAAPTANGTPPTACDSIGYNRFRNSEATEVDALLLLMPGVFSGTNIFNQFARNIIFDGQRRFGLDIEVVTLDRRDNCLEDLTGMNAAEAARDIQEAIDYYYFDKSIDGKTFAGLYTSETAPFLSEFGLKLMMDDVQAVLEAVMPNPLERKQKAFVGGHSMGGSLTNMFAGWDFDGDPSTTEDAGFANIAGLIRLDSGITYTENNNTGGGGLFPTTTPEGYLESVAKLRAGSSPRFGSVPILTPETLMLLEIAGMAAHWEPDAEFTALDEIPLGTDPKLLLRLVHSRSYGNALLGQPSIFDFRFTNEAFLGSIMDDNFMPVSIIQISMGHLADAEVVKKTFPITPILQQLIDWLNFPFADLINGDQLYITGNAGADQSSLGSGPLYGWATYDEVASKDDPSYQSNDGTVEFTNYIEEVTEISDVARSIYEGEANFAEWYMSERLMLDLQGASLGVDGLNYFHGEAAKQLPLIEFIAAMEPETVPTGVVGKVVFAPGYNHLDVVTAAANKPQHRENIVHEELLDFLQTLTSDE